MKLRIEKAIYGGSGLARVEGKAIFVPFSLPGEEVEAVIKEDRRSHATAELSAIVDASAARVDPPCPYFGVCGGCHYQHAAYAEQVEMKISILQETLERAHVTEVPAIQAVTGAPFGYRNRVRLHVQRNPFSLCYKKRGSHANLPVSTCPIAAPVVQRAIEMMNREGSGWGIGEWATEVEIFCNHDESAMLLALWTERGEQEAQRRMAKLWPEMQRQLPAIAGAGVFHAERGQRMPRIVARAGSQSLSYRCGNRDYRVGLGSFFQVNRTLIDRLVEIVTADEQGRTAWDLYAGVGLFSAALASSFGELAAVESSASAVRDLRENLRGTKHRIAALETLAFLRGTAQRGDSPPDLVVADPPRSGLGSDVTRILGQIRPARITYVSCDPATLSRDLAALLESGYRLDAMHLVDLFPQTYHLESVTRLTLA